MGCYSLPSYYAAEYQDYFQGEWREREGGKDVDTFSNRPLGTKFAR